jgi:hypothetical protein
MSILQTLALRAPRGAWTLVLGCADHLPTRHDEPDPLKRGGVSERISLDGHNIGQHSRIDSTK